MKRILIVITLALTAGICAFSWMRLHRNDQGQSVLLRSMPELAWVREELNLSDEQFAKVRNLHASYLPKCTIMCERIAEAHLRLEKAAQGEKEISTELEDAIKDHADIHAECQQEMLKHLYKTSEFMNEEQAARYLKVMMPYALDFSYSEPQNAHVH